MVRAKFQLQSIESFRWGGQKLRFSPVYDTTTEENRRFCKATPSGELWMIVDNPEALEQFKLGGYYCLDFSPAE